jgi:hypothetical protein
MTGDQQGVKAYFNRLLKVADRADQPGRRELVEARGSMSGQD